jgi:spermidine synthase
MTAAAAPSPDRARRFVLFAIGALGVSAVMTQLTLMRELLGAFSGNELVFGLAIGSWLLLTGVGAWLGRATERLRQPETVFVVGLIAAALLPLGQIAAVRMLRDSVFVRGAVVGLPQTVLGCLGMLLPFCLVSGALLTLGSHLADRGGGNRGPGPVYVADTLGGLVGGACFSFALVPWFDHFGLLCFPATLLLVTAGLVAGQEHARRLAAGAFILAAGVPAAALYFDLDALTTARQHAGRTVVARHNSPYGRLVITADAGQLTFFENGVPVITSPHLEQIEETVHYAMAQRPDAREVLLIGGGVTGTAREILRYGVSRVTYVELDPQIIAAGRRFLPGALDDPRIEVVNADGRRFTQMARNRFDVVIVALADPSTFQLNRFYTAEFFAATARALRPDGVLSLGLSRYANYVSPELGRLLASAHRTLRQSFAHVRMIPGGRVYFLASNGPLSLDIAARLEARGLATKLVNRHYLDATLAPDRLADLDRAVAAPAGLNADFSPALHAYHLRHWLSQFPARGWWLGGAVVVLLIGYGWTLRPLPRVIFASGFAASGLEIVLLLGFQAVYGSVYRQVGLIVTVFMAGLAAGAWWAHRRWLPGAAHPAPAVAANRLVAGLGVAIAGFAAVLPFILVRLDQLDASMGSALAGQAAVLLATLLLAGMTGAQFSLAGPPASGAHTGVAAQLFSADLIGAAGGALVVSALLIPLFGVPAACFVTAGLNLVTAGIAFAQARPA